MLATSILAAEMFSQVRISRLSALKLDILAENEQNLWIPPFFPLRLHEALLPLSVL